MRDADGLILFDPGLPERDDSETRDTTSGGTRLRELHSALVFDASCRLRDITFASSAAYIADKGIEDRSRAKCPSFRVEPQSEGAVSLRLHSAMEEQFNRGIRRLVLLFPSAATISLRTIKTAFSLLDAFDDALILGPATGGNLYALGLRHPNPDLCASYEGSESGRLERMLKAVSHSESAVYLLPPRYDACSGDIARQTADADSAEGLFPGIKSWLAAQTSSQPARPDNAKQ